MEYQVLQYIEYEVTCTMCGASTGRWGLSGEAAMRAILLGFQTLDLPADLEGERKVLNLCSACPRDWETAGGDEIQ